MPGETDKTAWTRFSEKGDALIAFLEKDRFSLVGVFIYVIVLALGRDMAEYLLLDTAFLTGSHPWIFSIAHHVAFYVVVFLGLVLLLTAFSGRGFRKAMNLIASIYWLILLPPFLDHFLFGSDTGYSYFSWSEFVNAFFHFSGASFHPGQGLEIVAFLFALFAYVIWTHRDEMNFFKERSVTLLRVAFLVLFTIISMFIIATPEAYLPVGSEGGVPVFPNFASTHFYQYHLFLVMYYLLAGLLLVTLISYLTLKRTFRQIVMSMRPFQTVLFGMIVAGGMVVGWMSVNDDLVFSITSKPYWVNIEFVVLSVVSALIAWQVCTIWNDVSDSDTDSPNKLGRTIASGKIGRKTMLQWSAVLMLVALSIAYLLSWTNLLILSAVFLLSYLYSFPPLRLKRNALSPAIIGFGGFLAFIYGYLTPFSVVNTVYSNDTPVIFLDGSVDVAALDQTSLMIALIIFVGLLVGSMVTDLDGYEEDSRGGIRTVYTALGLESGVKLVAVMIFLCSLMTLVLFHQLTDLILFPALGAAAAIVFHRYRSPKYVMALALAGFVYATFRYLGML